MYRTVDGVAILDPGNALNTEELGKVFQAAMSDETIQVISLDLRQVAFLDSAGMGYLVGLHKQAEGAGKKLYLFGLQEYIRKLVEITRLDRVLNIVAFENDVLAKATR